jgi:hypothetical protein
MGSAIPRDHLIVHSCRYLELTIFYRTSVIAKAETPFWAGTPFALQTLKLQWRSGD